MGLGVRVILIFVRVRAGVGVQAEGLGEFVEDFKVSRNWFSRAI